MKKSDVDILKGKNSRFYEFDIFFKIFSKKTSNKMFQQPDFGKAKTFLIDLSNEKFLEK